MYYKFHFLFALLLLCNISCTGQRNKQDDTKNGTMNQLPIYNTEGQLSISYENIEYLTILSETEHSIEYLVVVGKTDSQNLIDISGQFIIGENDFFIFFQAVSRNKQENYESWGSYLMQIIPDKDVYRAKTQLYHTDYFKNGETDYDFHISLSYEWIENSIIGNNVLNYYLANQSEIDEWRE
jgi:hypothetical protein